MLTEQIELNREAFKLSEQIKEVITKFDGKVLNKRLQTALKGIDQRILVETQYNSFIIELYVNSMYNGWTSVNICHGAISSAYGDGMLTDDKRIKAEKINKQIDENKEYRLKYHQDMEDNIKRKDKIVKEYNELVKKCKEFNESVNYTFGYDMGLYFKQLKEY